MPGLQKLQKWVEAINNYYAFGLLVYVVALYIVSNSHLFFWVFIVATPLLAGWTGYLAKSLVEQRNQRHGFRILSDVVSYKIGANRSYTLQYSTEIKACLNHLMVYPVGYQWTGDGQEALPKVTGKGQQLLAVVESPEGEEAVKVAPYKVVSTEGWWHYWFIALNPPIHKGQVIEIKYSQEFYDEKELARPELYYFVRIPMKRLELNVKFPSSALPKAVTSSYVKSSDPSRPYLTKGVRYEPDKLWATWVVEHPKKGYCYRIQWE